MNTSKKFWNLWQFWVILFAVIAFMIYVMIAKPDFSEIEKIINGNFHIITQ